MADWAQRLEEFAEHLRSERRVSSSAQNQYRSIVKDWVEFSLARGHNPAAFDQTLVDKLLDHRAHRNSKGVLAASSRESYTSNLRVFCNWASAERSRQSSQALLPRAGLSSSTMPRVPQERRAASNALSTQSTAPDHRSRATQDGDTLMASPTRPESKRTSRQPAPPTSSPIWIEPWQGPLPSPIDALEQLLQQGGTTIVRAAFQYSFFAHPNAVRGRTPWYPERARTNQGHYPDRSRGSTAQWQGRTVTLDDNGYAQRAWEKYTGRPIERGSGFGVRHIWGHPWDPDAFTAGWNLCYMPFWAGMLTEKQHPHPQLEEAVRQAAWNLYFGTDAVCEPPGFVTDPGIDLGHLLGTQPIRVLQPASG